MSFPGCADSGGPGWWREVVTTPPCFSGTGTLTTNSTAVRPFSATFQMMTISPVAGQQVSGTGIPAGTTVATVTDAADFTLSQAATASGSQSLAIGCEPVSLGEAKLWARVEFSDDDSLIQDIIRAAREWCEGPELKRALMLQGRTY